MRLHFFAEDFFIQSVAIDFGTRLSTGPFAPQELGRIARVSRGVNGASRNSFVNQACLWSFVGLFAIARVPPPQAKAPSEKLTKPLQAGKPLWALDGAFTAQFSQRTQRPFGIGQQDHLSDPTYATVRSHIEQLPAKGGK